jgi:hypothetical protein
MSARIKEYKGKKISEFIHEKIKRGGKIEVMSSLRFA